MGGCYSAEMRRPAIRSTAHDPILSYPTYQPPIQDVSLQISVPNCVPLRGYTIRFGKQDLTYGIEAAWISHGLGLIWVLADVISKVHDYGTTIYRQPANCYMKRASTSNFLNFLLASTINSKLYL